ncbi:MAG: ATP-binding protein, partial [Bacteroidales bacterium]|nr:ATP-binding protein [Bacteroidales bacterium]
MKNMTLVALLACAAVCGCASWHEGSSHASPEWGRMFSDDISNKMITAFEEDGCGHIWIGTFRGLNRFNSYDYSQFFCTDEEFDIPDNHVTALHCGSDGRLWVSTVNGTCYYTPQGDFKQVPIVGENKYVVKILETGRGRIFLNTFLDFYAYNPETEVFETVLSGIDPDFTMSVRGYVDGNAVLWVANPTSLRCYNSESMNLLDSIALTGSPSCSALLDNGELWLAGQGSVQIMDVNTHRFKTAPSAIAKDARIANDRINCMEPYGDGLLLNTDRHGLLYYNRKEEVVVGSKEGGFPFEAPTFKVMVMYTDSQGNLWIGSDDQGYVVRSGNQKRFNSNYMLRSAFEGKSVVALQKDGEDRLWILTHSDGLWLYDGKSLAVKQIELPSRLRVNGYEPNVNYIFIDARGDLWLITENNTVTHCTFDGVRLRIEETFSLYGARYMIQDRDGVMWVSTNGWYVFVKGPKEEQFEVVEVSNPTFMFIPTILQLNDGSIMLAAYNYPFKRIDPATRSVENLPFTAEDFVSSIRRSVLIPVDMFQDSFGDVWIGTIANGLLRYSTSDNSLVQIQGTSCSDVSGIEEDEEGNIWVSTLFGLCKYDRNTGRFTNWYASDGIGGNQFNERVSCVLDDGTLVFGGTHGLTIFDPEDVNLRAEVPLVFEDLKVFNRRVLPSADGPIDKVLPLRPDIRIRHYQNGFSISFAALNYSRFRHVRYSYKMEGFDDYWKESNSAHEAFYTKLPAGKYVFRVRVTDNERSMVGTESSINVVVNPAPWNSWWAWCVYGLLLLSVVAAIVHFRRRLLREREAAKILQMEKEQERRVNKMNMSFFANVSHEFRVPLSVISGPVEQLCASEDITGENRNLLVIVRRSVQRMMRLVNQLLDFNKLEDDALRLKVKRGDIVAQMRRFLDVFGVMAREKDIALSSCGLEDSFLMYMDSDKIDKICANLLSNAVKFTPAGGSIEVGFDVVSRSAAAGDFPLRAEDVEEQYVKLSVSDTGCGIPKDKLEKIFERYYQLENNAVGKYNYGSGIGLYYARRLAELHHGYLKAFGREDGESGSVFVLLLPVSEGCYSEEEFDRGEETAQ